MPAETETEILDTFYCQEMGRRSTPEQEEIAFGVWPGCGHKL